MDNVFYVVLALILFFSYMDAKQIIPFTTIDTPEIWDLYNQYTGPAIWTLWYIVILAIGIIWYIIFKDRSESIGLVTAGWALIWFGTQDIFYFIFSSLKMADSMCWADMMAPIRVISDFMGETCPSPISFTASAILGVFISYYLYNYFKEARW